jgi:hypothetical protein
MCVERKNAFWRFELISYISFTGICATTSHTFNTPKAGNWPTAKSSLN